MSQDRSDVYLTFAEYDKRYEAYIRDNNANQNTAERSFLRMNQVGPYYTDNMSHMRALGQIILAFTLQCSEGEGKPKSDDDVFGRS